MDKRKILQTKEAEFLSSSKEDLVCLVCGEAFESRPARCSCSGRVDPVWHL